MEEDDIPIPTRMQRIGHGRVEDEFAQVATRIGRQSHVRIHWDEGLPCVEKVVVGWV